MNNVIDRRAMSRRTALVGALSLLFARGVRADVNVTAISGLPLPCHWYWWVDAKGKEWPVTIKITARPQHGRVSTQTVDQTVRLRTGQYRRVRATQVVYQSKKGFTGEDTFAYLWLTKDPADPRDRAPITISVTVR